MRHWFPRSIEVIVTPLCARQIDNVADAIAFLDEYPRLLQDEAFQATLSACREARSGTKTTHEAYDVFCAFARRRGILIPDAMAELASSARGRLAAYSTNLLKGTRMSENDNPSGTPLVDKAGQLKRR